MSAIVNGEQLAQVPLTFLIVTSTTLLVDSPTALKGVVGRF
jgi:hypothetical protein